jgi:hypothetical protein
MRRRLGCLALAVLFAGGCSEDEPEAVPTSAATPTVSAPDVEVPEGVELTEPGAELPLGEPASAVFRAGRDRVSTIEVRVTRVVKGSMKRDFTNFGLTAKQLQQEPYYVSVKVTNTGPNPLGGASAPVWALDSGNTYFPATTLVGHLPACQGGPLPKPFATGDSVSTCLLFLAEAGTTVEEIQLRPYEGFDPVVWVVPQAVEVAAQRRERREQAGGGKGDRPRKPSGRG